MGPKILVTGGGGQVGRAFSTLVSEEHVVSRNDLDVTDRGSVLNAIWSIQPDVVVNAAAYTKVDAAEADESTAALINANGPKYLAEACADVDSLLVQISTDYVFSGEKIGPYTEDDPTDPRSVYGRTKLEGERAAAVAPKHLIVRTSWVFGDGPNFVKSILAAGQTRKELNVVDDQVGRPTYAEDLAEGLMKLIDAGATGLLHLTNTGEPGTWADVAEAALTAAGSTTKVNRISTAKYFEGNPGPIAPRPANSVLDCTKAESLGAALRDWRPAVAAYVAALA